MATTVDRRHLLRGILDGIDVQRHVVGALMMRELQTRFGRDNIGYIWILVEPLLLAATVATIHFGNGGTHYGSDLRIVPFTLGGYCTFMIFRSIVTRAESTVESNKPLLFHRMVSIFDMLLARALLEMLATVAAFVLLLGVAIALGLADLPARPLRLMAAIFLLSWFAFALSMGIAAAAHHSRVFQKLVHPLTYIAMPLSGAFFVLSWIPEPFRSRLAWSPLNQIFEMVHSGQFGSIENAVFDSIYIVGWCMALTVLGLLALTSLRRHVHLS